MANTVLTSKQTFEEALIMDLSPDNTLSNCLTGALNATILTLNGNEMSLLNDMGNARVETAFLPEGYIPIGTCEFGDIIYIVSYNPLINKSLIGCFPSPERNISSDEVSDINASIRSSELASNGRINAMSVKKVLFDKKLRAGDKFMVYTTDNLRNNKDYLSDYGNTAHIHRYWPKLTKIHIVSIEDSGKTTVLDSSVKWYDNDYYINQTTNTITNSQDLDAYRNLVSSAWSIFQSKISGKLALLIELESITGFSCTHTVKTRKSGNSSEYSVYFNPSWTTDHNDVNPSGIIILNAGWKQRIVDGKDYTGKLLVGKNGVLTISLPSSMSKSNNFSSSSVIEFSRIYDLANPSSSYNSYLKYDSYNALVDNIVNNLLPVPVYNITLSKELGRYYCNLSAIKDGTYYYVDATGQPRIQTAQFISDDIVNNYFFKDVRKYIGTLPPITTKVLEGDTIYNSDRSNLIWEYTVAPVMPYGVLELFAITNSIDFSLVEEKDIRLTDWRYYNSGELSTLVTGFDIYTPEGYGVSEICLEFNDNQGIAAAYHITNKSSYSGEFINYIQLNSRNRNHQLNNIDSNGTIFTHVGAPYNEENESDDIVEMGGLKYYNDAGTLYPNLLYLVKIVVKYDLVNELGLFSNNPTGWEYFYRWYWTTTVFNDQYFNNIKDFIVLQPKLYLNSSIQFTDVGINQKLTTYHYSRTDENTLGAVIAYINLDSKTENIKAHVNIGLQYDYGVFNINELKSNLFNGKMYLGKSSITSSYNGIDNDLKPVIPEEEELLKTEAGYVPETLGTEFYKSLKLEEKYPGNPDNEIYSTEESYKEYKDTFSIEFKDSPSGTEKVAYKNINGEEVEETYKYIPIEFNKDILLVLSGIRYCKFKYTKKESYNYLKYTSILNKYGLDLLSLGFEGSHMFFTTVGFIGIGDRHDNNPTRVYFSIGNTSSNKVPLTLLEFNHMTPGGGDDDKDNDIREFNLHTYREMPSRVNYLPNVPVPLYLIGYDDDEGNDWTKRIDVPYRIPKLQLALWNTNTNNSSLYANYIPSGCNSKANTVSTLTDHVNTLAFRYNSVMYVINDMFMTDQYGWTLTFGTHTPNLYNANSVGYTLADFIANLYGNLYMYSSDEKLQVGVDLQQDLSNEIWNKEIITKLEVTGNQSDILLFHGYLYTDYVNLIKSKVSGFNSSNSNVEFIIESETRCTDISFNLEGAKVQELEINNVIVLETSEGDIFADRTGKGTYFVLQDKELMELSSATFIPKVKSWTRKDNKYFPVPDKKIVFKVPLLVLSLIKCEDGRVYFDGGVLESSANAEVFNWIAEEDSDKIAVSPFYNFSLLNNLTWNG